jgi:hypothetical protein
VIVTPDHRGLRHPSSQTAHRTTTDTSEPDHEPDLNTTLEAVSSIREYHLFLVLLYTNFTFHTTIVWPVWQACQVSQVRLNRVVRPFKASSRIWPQSRPVPGRLP